MASRKEEKERRKTERLEAERREKEASRKRLLRAYTIAGALAVVAVAVIVAVVVSSGGSGGGASSGSAAINTNSGSTNGVAPDERAGIDPPAVKQTDLKKAASAAGCTLRLNLADEGNSHIPPNAPTPKYGTNPPTSGNHVVPPLQQADGAYREMPPEINFVHSLEHGRVEIQYAPNLSERDQLALKGVFDQSPEGMLLFPNSKMPYEVAATAWTQLMGCKRYEGAKTLDAISDFRDQFRGHGPEPVPLNP